MNVAPTVQTVTYLRTFGPLSTSDGATAAGTDDSSVEASEVQSACKPGVFDLQAPILNDLKASFHGSLRATAGAAGASAGGRRTAARSINPRQSR